MPKHFSLSDDSDYSSSDDSDHSITDDCPSSGEGSGVPPPPAEEVEQKDEPSGVDASPTLIYNRFVAKADREPHPMPGDAETAAFWAKINAEHRQGVVGGWAEPQNGQTGIMLDFDYKQITFTPQITAGHQKRVVEEVAKLLLKNFDLNGEFAPDIHIAVAERPYDVIDGEERLRTAGGGMFKHGFHLLIPEILTTRDVKLSLVKQISELNFSKILSPAALYDFDIIDGATATVPVYLVGSSAPKRKEYHKLTALYKFDADEGLPSMATIDLAGIKKYNHPLEFSINKWGIERLLNKKAYPLTPYGQTMTEQRQAEAKQAAKLQENAECKYMPNASTIDLVAEKRGIFLELIRGAVMTLPPEFSDQTGKWIGILSLLKNLTSTYRKANLGGELAELAVEFSQRSDKFKSAEDVTGFMERAKPYGQVGLLLFKLRQTRPIAYKRYAAMWLTEFPPTIDFRYWMGKAAQVSDIEGFNQLKSDMVADLNKKLCLIKSEKSYFMASFVDFDEETGKRREGWHHKGLKSMQLDYKNKNISVKLSPEIMKESGLKAKDLRFNWFELWLNDINRLEVDRIALSPRVYQKDLEDGGTRGANLWNLYRGAGISRESLDGVEIPDDFESHPFFRHILNRWCDGNEKVYWDVLNRFAHHIQFPWVKMGSGMVLRGSERTGKGMIIQMIFQIIGTDYLFQPTSQDQVLGTFNDGLLNCLGLFLDEMTWGGHKERAGMLKKVITEKFFYVNKKMMPLEKVLNILNVYVASNEQWVVPVGATEQRWEILEVSNELAVMPEAAKKKAISDILSIDMNQLAKFFYTRDVSAWNHRTVNNTHGLRKQKIMGLPDLRKWWLARLERGCYDNGSEISEYEARQNIFKDYQQCKGDRHLTEQNFWAQMAEFTKPEPMRRIQHGGKRRQCVAFKLEANREIWRKVYADEAWPFEEVDEAPEGGWGSDEDSGSDSD
jgi:hypothetical protein